jgi:predicted GTPase
MLQLKLWQWIILAAPLAVVGLGLVGTAAVQLHAWGVSWLWAMVGLIGLGWRWLLVRWTRPPTKTSDLDAAQAEVRSQLDDTLAHSDEAAVTVAPEKIEAVLNRTLTAAQEDVPLWEDWGCFGQRCQTLVAEVAQLYHPEEEYPLLNIYVPQAYGLIRGTIDDLDRWVQAAAPALNQVSISQVYRAYKTYRQFETPLKRVMGVLSWGQWLWNPVVAATKQVSKPASDQANQQLLGNFSQILREMALTNLCRQAVLLYSGQADLSVAQLSGQSDNSSAENQPHARSQSLKALLEQAEPADQLDTQAVNLLLVGRTGAGKSSLINTLFQEDLAKVDVLPSTDQLSRYRWQSENGQTLLLWDSPGYEQVQRPDLRQQVLDQAATADAVLLVTPALDPALDADKIFLQDLAERGLGDVPILVGLTQVDRLRPLREWQPPYDWRQGDRPKERNIRAAIAYRKTHLGERIQQVWPVVTAATKAPQRDAWGGDELAQALVDAIPPAKAQRLAQFLSSRAVRVQKATEIIDRYAKQMAGGQSAIALVKTPLFNFIATRLVGIPALGRALAETIPAEQVPGVVAKLMLSYELAELLQPDPMTFLTRDLLKLWPLLLRHNDIPADRNAWAWGHALVEYWTQDLTRKELATQFDRYLTPGDSPARIKPGN